MIRLTLKDKIFIGIALVLCFFIWDLWHDNKRLKQSDIKENNEQIEQAAKEDKSQERQRSILKAEIPSLEEQKKQNFRDGKKNEERIDSFTTADSFESYFARRYRKDTDTDR